MRAERGQRLQALAEEALRCYLCPLGESRRLAVPGEGPPDAALVLVGEAPGEKEDETGRPYVGNTGHLLDHLLEGAGLDRQEIFITGAVKCRPPGNRTPRASEIEVCARHYLWPQIQIIRPRIICPQGTAAVRAVLGPGFKLSEVRGRPLERDGRIIFATHHPAAVFYREELKITLEQDLASLACLLRQVIC
ncbi:MAG: uracil-DNA glycosylase [Bacillota bacterium]